MTPRQCSRQHCETIFTPKREDGMYCSRSCANYATKEARKARRYSPQTQERIKAQYGAPIIEPQLPPVCHGQQLSFGSNPHTGMTIQYCHVCGEKPLPRHGAVRYPQRPDFEAELQEKFESTKRPPKKSHGRSMKSWQENFQVIGKELAEKIHAN